MKKIELETLVADLTARLDAVKEEQKAAEENRKAKLSPKKKLALAIGGVGVAVLALSVFHCTEALMALTGSHAVLALLLAVGIDAGMVACELGLIAAKDDKKIFRWGTAYIVLAVVLSCGLNGWASQHNAEEGLKIAAAGVGGLIPVLVFILGKVAGLMWDAE
jgi:hypothetical protein